MLSRLPVLTLGLCLWSCWHAPALASPSSADLPVLTLPWGKWQAEIDEQDPQLYVFRNVRFASEPRRFGAPAFPTWTNDSIQSPESVSCIAVDVGRLSNPPGGHVPLEDPERLRVRQDEDCLFLDVYVPARAFEPGARKLPVIVWIYGGAYAFGSKNDGEILYTGRPIVKASNYNTILVAGNYRAGAFGFLAGDYMQRAALPNAGLYDQALLFEWVGRFVDQVGGDKEQVSAWGQSAGAGSILHHLIREDGARDPGFRTYYAMSPAFEMAWDNAPGGRLDAYYRMYSDLAGCGDGYDVDCLRAARREDLVRANQQLFDAVRQTGLFPVGPAVDGRWVTTLPSILLSQGRRWDKVESGIVAHCSNESAFFNPPGIESERDFDGFLATFLPGDALAPQRRAIKAFYACPETHGGNFSACLETVIRDAVFTCNTRYLFEAYPERSHMMEYAFASRETGYHGVDLIPLFTNSVSEARAFIEKLGTPPELAQPYAVVLHSLIVPKFTKYLASFAVSGDPNGAGVTPLWPTARDTEQGVLHDVLQVRDILAEQKFRLGEDEQNTKTTCDFWLEIAAAVRHKPEGAAAVQEEGEL
ncbi:carboxylesterase family protein [Metarhizium album ARSEF 1941]|uniref:Carboxylesterase family protein n=1 Tax=Metarhizium album (strain ARSEF 1941) TaxID=1081103 RepID=A0A0B2WJ22_METAS|nr:carboxylesterase family protein [Metarhizium album ARSEF 1941]KHN96046.1 carboxylesterase family protein [Metarhizium album ARSEF 1941]